MGAGVIPFAKHEQQVKFLFQTVFSGRKTGYLIDFGGGFNEGETYQQTAVRELIEETETMFFAKDCNDLNLAKKTPLRIAEQTLILTKLFDSTLQKHPHWWCKREPGNKKTAKNWITFFIEFEYQDVRFINQQWKMYGEDKMRFSKPRELHWIDADRLLYIYEHQPEKLWKRVRQLINVRDVICEIKQESVRSINSGQ
ncbi:MAG: NUDIX domain-containing protein [Pseudomonadota bacterium]